MSKPKVLIYAPREEPVEIRQALAEAGLAVAFGDRAWTLQGGGHEDDLVAAARDAPDPHCRCPQPGWNCCEMCRVPDRECI